MNKKLSLVLVMVMMSVVSVFANAEISEESKIMQEHFPKAYEAVSVRAFLIYGDNKDDVIREINKQVSAQVAIMGMIDYIDGYLEVIHSHGDDPMDILNFYADIKLLTEREPAQREFVMESFHLLLAIPCDWTRIKVELEGML